jgi:tetratricopeptide (TPR) repeat protein
MVVAGETEESPGLEQGLAGLSFEAVMTGFTRALGVHCSYCHKGQEGQALSTYDFASDENPNKNRAREMMRMLGDINVHLKKIEPSGDQRVNMWCHTCHRGRPRPMSLEEELGEQYRLKGVDAAINHYQDLKRNYSQKGAYDFSERSLNNFGYEVLEKKDTAAAIRVFMIQICKSDVAFISPQAG